MYTAAIKLLLLFSLIVEHEHTVCASDNPTIRLRNGTVLENNKRIYIRKDEPLELYCTGEASNLRIINCNYEYEGKTEATTIVNETTIRLFLQRPGQQRIYYECKDIKTNNNAEVFVEILAVPKTTDFRCYSKNLDYFNCTWTIPGEVGNCKSSLYYVEEGHSTLLCNVNNYDYAYSPVCLWDDHHPLIPYDLDADELTFMLETCNDVACTNETFTFDHIAVVKFDPPVDLELVRKSSHSATLEWFMHDSLPSLNYETKISYWYPGKEPVAVNTTSLQNQTNFYHYVLELPCANTYYEVRVSMRPGAAKEEQFWSDDATIGLTTDPDPDDVDAGNPAYGPPAPQHGPEDAASIPSLDGEAYSLPEKAASSSVSGDVD